MLPVLVFLLGILIGSFLNVCIYRLPRGESIAFPPSHCPQCGKNIKYRDLVPVASYLILRGRCRFCKSVIPARYPFVETLTGALFLVTYFKFGFGISFLKNAVFLSILLVVAFIDSEYSIIPGKLMIFGLAAGIILNIVGYKSNGYMLDYLYGSLLGGGVIFLIVALTGGMGGGDIQIMAVAGLFLGLWNTLLTLILSFIIGAGAGITLIILKKKNRRDYIPFGPWISVSAFIALFFGKSIIDWYISLL